LRVVSHIGLQEFPADYFCSTLRALIWSGFVFSHYILRGDENARQELLQN